MRLSLKQKAFSYTIIIVVLWGYFTISDNTEEFTSLDENNIPSKKIIVSSESADIPVVTKARTNQPNLRQQKNVVVEKNKKILDPSEFWTTSIFNSDEQQHIGVFIDPDTYQNNTSVVDNEKYHLGEFIDPDNYTLNARKPSTRINIGEQISPDDLFLSRSSRLKPRHIGKYIDPVSAGVVSDN